MKKYRILYIENGLQGGGSAESLLQLLIQLDNKKFEPLVLFTSRTPYVQRLSDEKIRTIVFDNWYISRPESFFRKFFYQLTNFMVVYGAKFVPIFSSMLDSVCTFFLRKKLLKLLQYEKIDLVHTNNNISRDYWAITTTRKAGVPCVSHIRSFHAMSFTSKKARVINNTADKVICYSRSIMDYWVKKGLEPKISKIIPNAIGEVEVKQINIYDIFKLKTNAPVIGIIGQIIPERGHDILIQSLPAICKEVPDLQMLIVGRGEKAIIQNLSRQISELGLEDTVVFTGHYNNAKEIIASLDAIVLPYLIEPFGRTLLEAWQLETPVVVSNVGYINDIVEHEKDVLIFDINKQQTLSSEITRLLSDKDLSDRIAKQGKKKCLQHFSIESHSAAVEKIYYELI